MPIDKNEKNHPRLGNLAILLVAAAGATAHHIYEQHLSSGYAPIFKAAMMGTYEERSAYIHDALVAVRTDKDREVEAKLEKMQEDATEKNTVSNCAGFEAVADAKHEKFKEVQAASDRGQASSDSAIAAGDESIEANNADLACDAADGKTMMAAVGQLWVELRHTAGLPLN